MTAPGDAHDDDLDDVHLGEVPEGLGSDLHAKNLESLSRDPAFSDGVLSLADTDGARHEIALDEVDALEDDTGSNRTKIILRSGVVIVATGAVIAGAIAAVRYRRRKR